MKLSPAANPPGWFDSNACDTCAGTGSKVLATSYRRSGRLSSVSFSLKDACHDCGGTGFRLALRKEAPDA